MIDLKRTIKIQIRDKSKDCLKNCSLCRTPCDKAGKYVEKELTPSPSGEEVAA